MTALIIILGLLVIIAIGFAFSFVFKYAIREYSFNLLGIGWLSLIPPALASIGFFIFGRDYFKALQQGNLDVVVSLGVAVMAFIGIFIFFYQKTNLWIALFTMLVAPLCLLICILYLIGQANADRQGFARSRNTLTNRQDNDSSNFWG
ncbi:MAG: hypothetical protein PUP92_24100 [Rhizonema sp. PD38]|nr:hypothetical protein [Rhizonema sp. PD38]